MGSLTFASVLIVTASILAVTTANRASQFGFNPDSASSGDYHPKSKPAPKVINVGGPEGWRFNFSYTDWAIQNGPFYINDTLVFKYDPPTDNTKIPHSVHLLRDPTSFLTCDFVGAEMLANETQGGGKGFHFLLTKLQPHYFACGTHNGAHCKLGLMKFSVMPMLRDKE